MRTRFSSAIGQPQQGASKGAALAEEGADGREMPKTGLRCDRMGRIEQNPHAQVKEQVQSLEQMTCVRMVSAPRSIRHEGIID